MPPRVIDLPVLSENIKRRLQALPALPLVVLDTDINWIDCLKNGDRCLSWTLFQMDPESDWSERLKHNSQWRSGGWLWSPLQRRFANLPHGWRQLDSPWSTLGRWLCKSLNIKGRHVTMIAGSELGLEALAGWLMSQGASLSWCPEDSRHLRSQIRLCDILLIFPDSDILLEAYQLGGVNTLIDLRPGAAGLSGNALQVTLSCYSDASQGALGMLLPCLALAQQERLIGLA